MKLLNFLLALTVSLLFSFSSSQSCSAATIANTVTCAAKTVKGGTRFKNDQTVVRKVGYILLDSVPRKSMLSSRTSKYDIKPGQIICVHDLAPRNKQTLLVVVSPEQSTKLAKMAKEKSTSASGLVQHWVTQNIYQKSKNRRKYPIKKRRK